MPAPLDTPALRLHALTTAAYVAGRHRAGEVRRRASHDDRGEGVVSAALVVLIMAAIAVLMWVGFRTMWTNIEADTNEKISQVGN